MTCPNLGGLNIPLNKPIVGMAVDPVTGGYWLVGGDGGVFKFNAPFLGSTGSIKLNKPVVGMTAANNGSGYWFVASDGGIFAYGVPLLGIDGRDGVNKPVVGMAVDARSDGYLAGGVRWRKKPLLLQRSVLWLNWKHRLEQADCWHGSQLIKGLAIAS